MNGVYLELGRIIAPARLRRAGEKDFPVLSMTMRDGLVDQAEKFKKRVASADTSPYKVVERNQLVVGFPIDEGVLAFQNLYDEAIVSPAYDVWSLRDSSLVASEYLERFLRSPMALTFYAGKLRGTTARRRTLPDDIFLSLRVPLPPLAEQQRIAEVLDRAEALRAKRRAALVQLDSLTQSLFLDIFGDPVSNAKGWPSLSLEKVLSIPLRNGLSPSNAGKVSAKVLTLSAITGSGFDATAWKTSNFMSAPPANQSVDELDFLICRGNGNVRMVGKGYFPTKAMPEVTFPDTMIAARISPDRIERAFLQHVWNSPAVRKQVESLARTTNGTFKVNQTMLDGIAFVVPPLPLQREFARRVGAVEKLKMAQRSSLAELDALFASLQNRAFRGEL